MRIITSSADALAAKGLMRSSALVRVTVRHDPNKRRRLIQDGSNLRLNYPAKKKSYAGRPAALLIRGIVRYAQSEGLRSLRLDFSEFCTLFDDNFYYAAEMLGRELVNANYNFTTYVTKPKDGHPSVDVVYIDNVNNPEADRILQSAAAQGELINQGREIGNTPANIMTPIALVGAAKALARGKNIMVKAYGVPDIKRLKLALLYSVGKASANPPRLIVMEYWGRGKDLPVDIAFVGKGVCFDSGGLSIKPSDGMKTMHLDKCGAVVAMTAIADIARRKMKKNVIVVIGAVENSVSGLSYRPSDIIESPFAEYVKILNTDAEGRLVLADAMHYAAVSYRPRKMVTLATLTGAAVVGLGDHYTGAFSLDDEFCEAAVNAGISCGNLIWRLPLDPGIHEGYLKAYGADIANIRENGDPKAGGASSAAMFLQHFATLAEVKHFLHLDIAPRMHAANDDELDPGATIEPVPVLVRLAEAA